jgi:hypothetical protein
VMGGRAVGGVVVVVVAGVERKVCFGGETDCTGFEGGTRILGGEKDIVDLGGEEPSIVKRRGDVCLGKDSVDMCFGGLKEDSDPRSCLESKGREGRGVEGIVTGSEVA